jgi:hypothetical protein
VSEDKDNVSVILGPQRRKDLHKAITDAISHIHNYSSHPDIALSVIRGLEFALDQLEPHP